MLIVESTRSLESYFFGADIKLDASIADSLRSHAYELYLDEGTKKVVMDKHYQASIETDNNLLHLVLSDSERQIEIPTIGISYDIEGNIGHQVFAVRLFVFDVFSHLSRQAIN
jgi:hypothetical protein